MRAHPERMRILSSLVTAAVVTLAIASPAAGEEQPRGEWPLRPQPEVIERFDPPDSAYGAGHRGVDLLGRVGQQVRAAIDGTVTFAGMLAGRGVVVVDHGDTRTTYEPVLPSVSVGQSVTAGAPIGALELTMSHCLPRACLHWGWIRNVDDVYLDPLLLVGLGPVRLLPLWQDEPVAPAVAVVPVAAPYGDWRPLAAQARGCACRNAARRRSIDTCV